jgi:hypothetical protein
MLTHTVPCPPGRARRWIWTRRSNLRRRDGPRVRSIAFGTVQTLLFALLVVPFTGLAAGPAHAAPPDRTPFLTWNMQGAHAQGANLWTNYLPTILNGAPSNVIMLQEAGADVPAGADVLPNPPGTVGNPLVTYANWHASQRPTGPVSWPAGRPPTGARTDQSGNSTTP